MKIGWPSVQNHGVLKRHFYLPPSPHFSWWGTNFPHSQSLCHTSCTPPPPFTTVDLTPPLWGRWLLSLVRFPYFLSHSCFSSWQSLSSRYKASFPLSWQQVKMLVPSPSSSSYSYRHIRITYKNLGKNADTCSSPLPTNEVRIARNGCKQQYLFKLSSYSKVQLSPRAST